MRYHGMYHSIKPERVAGFYIPVSYGYLYLYKICDTYRLFCVSHLFEAL